MTKEDIVRCIMSDYDLDDENPVRVAVDKFLKNGVDFNDGAVEVSDVAEYIINTSKYWKSDV